MKIEKLVPKPTQRIIFNLSSNYLLPKASGCYVLSTYDDIIIYIGLANNLNNRFKQHLDNPEKTNPTTEGKATWFYYKLYDSKNLEKLERTWLNQFQSLHGRFPILNKTSSPLR